VHIQGLPQAKFVEVAMLGGAVVGVNERRKEGKDLGEVKEVEETEEVEGRWQARKSDEIISARTNLSGIPFFIGAKRTHGENGKYLTGRKFSVLCFE
jgi:hypothetical protein